MAACKPQSRTLEPSITHCKDLSTFSPLDPVAVCYTFGEQNDLTSLNGKGKIASFRSRVARAEARLT